MDDYYGRQAGSDEQKTVQERCREFYGINDFVVVMNIDTRPYVYQIQRVENQSFDESDAPHMNITNIKPPERIVMQAGETRLVPAYEADLMIKGLIDKIVFGNREKIIEDSEGKETPKESVADASTQRKYIGEIYQGKRDFLSEYNASLIKPDVSGDLDDGPKVKAGKAPAGSTHKTT